MSTQIAVAPQGSTGAATPAPHPLMSFAPMLVVCGILYFLVIRPQQKQAKDHRKMVDGLKTGDRVLTQGGIFGTVVGLKGSVIIVKISDNVKVELSRSAITQVILEPSSGSVTPVIVGEHAS